MKSFRSLTILTRSQTTVANPLNTLKPFSEVPGPKSYPLIKSILGVKAPGVGRDPAKSIEIFQHMWKVYGDIIKVEVPMRPAIVFLFDPDHAEKIYRAAGAQPQRPGFDALRYVREQDPLTNQGAKGLLTSNGLEWQTFRSKVQQPMLRPKSTLRYTPELEAIAEEFIQKKIRAKINKDSQVGADFLDDLYQWALESVTCLALNARLGCLDDDLPNDSNQMKIIRAVSDIFATTMILDNRFQMWRYFPSPKLNKFTQGYNTFRDLCQVYILEALEDIKAKETNEGDEDPSLLEMFFARGCDENTAVVMAIDMMFAGVDTSSHVSAFLMYHLAKNPRVQEKLFEEVSKELPEKNSKLDLKALDRMPYMRATIKEIMRVSPPVGGMARLLPEPVELGGYQFPGNTVFVPLHFHMGMSERYVTNAKEFSPERWLRGSKQENLHPFLLMPFGHGPRMCVGRRFAEQEVSIFMAKLVQNFVIEWHQPDLTVKTETLIKPDSPLKFTFKER